MFWVETSTESLDYSVMTKSYQFPSELETVSEGYWVSKLVLGPGMIYVGIKGFHLAHPILTSLFCIPLVILGIFFVIITRLKPEAGVLGFRRFFQWQHIGYSEIRDCDDNLFLPFIGSIRLKHYVPPFGKIYFWIPIGADGRIDKEMIPYIRQRAGLAE